MFLVFSSLHVGYKILDSSIDFLDLIVNSGNRPLSRLLLFSKCCEVFLNGGLTAQQLLKQFLRRGPRDGLYIPAQKQFTRDQALGSKEEQIREPRNNQAILIATPH